MVTVISWISIFWPSPRVSSVCYAFALHATHRKPSLQSVFGAHSMAQRTLKIERKNLVRRRATKFVQINFFTP